MTYSPGWWGQLVSMLIVIGAFLNLIRLEIKHAMLGTKSVLYGAHCFLWHWFFVAKAWHALYGWKTVADRYVGNVSLKNPQLWFAFFLHDIGYIGKEKMDDEDGETHPELGATIMSTLFGGGWFRFVLLHSRYYAKTLGLQPSRLCVADKYSFVLTPRWLYLPFVRATGEIKEYMLTDQIKRANGETRDSDIAYEHEQRLSVREEMWYAKVRQYIIDWVAAHKDGADDTWTQSQQVAGTLVGYAQEDIPTGSLVEIDASTGRIRSARNSNVKI